MKKRKNIFPKDTHEILRLSALIALVYPVTLLVLGPFDIFGGNMAELAFSLVDFFPYCLLLALGLWSIIFLTLIFLPKKVFAIVFPIYLGLAMMPAVQSLFLNGDLTSLGGDQLSAGASTLKIVINALIWAALPLLMLLVFRFVKNKRFLSTLSIILIVTLVGMQLSTLISVAVSKDGIFENRNGSDDNPAADAMLSDRGLSELGDERNILYFVLDRFDASYYDTIAELAPECLSELDGFTYYADHLALYSNTFPAVCYMLTGVENDFSRSRIDYFSDAYRASPYLNALHDAGYSVKLYTEKYDAYETVGVCAPYLDNFTRAKYYEVEDSLGLSFYMAKLSLYRYLPFFAKENWLSSMSTVDIKDQVHYVVEQNDHVFDGANESAISYLAENPCSLTGHKNFSFIHVAGFHEIYGVGSDQAKANCVSAAKASMEIVNTYLRYLKANGLYEKATIVITGDHPNAISDTKEPKEPRLTALFVKRSGEYGGEDAGYRISDAQVMQEQIFPEILDAEGIRPVDSSAIPLSRVTKGDQKRRLCFVRRDEQDLELIEFGVFGKGSDFSNWTVNKRVRFDDRRLHD